MSGSGQVDIRPESLQAAAQSLATIAEQMADDVTRLQTAVTSNNPWGGDETGTLFAGIYNAVLGHTLEALASYVEQTGYAAAGLAQNAQEAAAADQSAAGKVSSAGSGL